MFLQNHSPYRLRDLYCPNSFTYKQNTEEEVLVIQVHDPILLLLVWVHWSCVGLDARVVHKDQVD